MGSDGDAMRMTERSKDFLRELNRLYRNKQEPVHYEAVAKGLGVSKWTAYDMLKKLVASGLARSEYVVSRGGGSTWTLLDISARCSVLSWMLPCNKGAIKPYLKRATSSRSFSSMSSFPQISRFCILPAFCRGTTAPSSSVINLGGKSTELFCWMSRPLRKGPG